jgi:hypothetical protein
LHGVSCISRQQHQQKVNYCAFLCRDELTQEEVETGWRVSFKGPHKVKMVQWTEAVSVLGFARAKGSMRRTYEVIASHGCTSYGLKRYPMPSQAYPTHIATCL